MLSSRANNETKLSSNESESACNEMRAKVIYKRDEKILFVDYRAGSSDLDSPDEDPPN